MREIWISSDFHFNHANILNFTTNDGQPIRNFSDVNEMNETMIALHNSVVAPGDIFYCLGDVFFGDKTWFEKNWPRLNGKKRLIVGNHDDVKFLSSGNFFEKVMLWRYFKEQNVILSHVPLHKDSLLKDGREILNVHGHTHINGSPDGPYTSVCVEMINYTPVHIESFQN